MPDLLISETESGDIIIGAEDLNNEEYLAFVQTLYNDGYIELRNDNHNCHLESGKNQFNLDDYNQIVISNGTLLERNVANGGNTIVISADSYELFQSTIELHYACKEVPAEVTLETDNDSNLVIRTADTGWLSAIIAGGNLYFYPQNEWSWVKHVSGTRVQVNGTEAVVSKSDLLGLSEGIYDLEIEITGYENFRGSVSLPGYRQELTAEISIVSSSGNLVITCDDTDFMNALAQVREYCTDENGTSYTDGGSISIYCDGQSVASYSNYHEVYYGSEQSFIEYEVSKNKITIKKQQLINNHVYNTDHSTIYLNAVGYGELVIEDIKLENVCKNEMPSDVQVSSDENGNLVITSNNTNWLKALAQPYTYKYNSTKKYYESQAAGGVVSLVKGYSEFTLTNSSYSGGSYNGHKDTNIVYANGKVTISSESLIAYGITNAKYSFLLKPQGYRIYESEEEVEITGGTEDVPTDVEARIDENGDLLITSSNYDFLEKVARFWVYDKNDVVTSRGGSIFLMKGNYYDDGEYYRICNEIKVSTTLSDSIVYDESNHVVRLSRGGIPAGVSGEYTLQIAGYGYSPNSVKSNFDFPFITVPSASMLAGGKAQFFVKTDKNISWSVNDESLATIDENGWLTALNPGTAYLSAQMEGNDYVDTIPVTISVPTNVSITASPAKADVVIGDTVQIVPTVKNGGDYYTVTYVSSDEEIATVNEAGLVTFLNPGTVTITSSVYGKSVNSVFTVYEYPKSDKLAASIDGYDTKNGMEALDSVVLKVSASGEEVESSSLEYASANEAIAIVDENGVITALKSGTVKITAKLKDDPAKRSVTYSLKVYPRVVRSLSLSVNETDEISHDMEEGILNLYFNAKSDLNKKFQLYSSGEDKLGNAVPLESLSYAPVDASVASVDKNGTVTIKKAGQTVIKVTVSSNPKEMDPVSCDVIVRVVDYAPKLESNKAVVNKYYEFGTDVKIYAIKGSEIEDIKLLNSKTLEESDFTVGYTPGEDHFNIKQSSAVSLEAKGKSYSEILRVTLTDGSVYDYAYTVSTSLTLPKVTVKPTGVYNSALDDSTLGLEITTDEEYDLILFGDKGIEWAYMDSDGVVHLLENASGKKITKGTVQIHFKNYYGANYKTNISFKTVSTLPAASLSGQDDGWFEKNTLILNENFSAFYTMNLTTDDDQYPVSRVEIKDAEKYSGLSVVYADQKLTVTRDTDIALKNGTYKYTITPYIDVKGTEKALKSFTLSVKTTDALPKVTLSSSSVKLNRNYHETVYVDVKTSEIPAGAGLQGFDVNGDERIYIRCVPINENMTVRLNGDLPKGTYMYELTPEYNNGLKGTPIKFTVTVIDSEAKATVSVKGNLNQLDPLSETNCIGTVKLSDITATVTDASIDSEYVDVSVNANGQLIFTLKNRNLIDQTLKNQKVTLSLDTGDVLETNVSVKVARNAPAVKLNQTTLNVYNTSERNVEAGRIALSEIPFGEIKAIWFSESLAYDLTYDAENHEIVVVLKDAAYIKAGSSSAITIKIDWEGDYGTYEQSLSDKTIKGLKTATLKLTVKDASSTVKAK